MCTYAREHSCKQSAQPQTTPYRIVVHEYGRYPVITGNKFFHNGYPYPVNTTAESGVRLDILTPIAAELDAILSSYSRVYLTRFDFRLPAGTPVDTANEWVSQLFKKLRERLKSKFRRPEGIADPQLRLRLGAGKRNGKTGALPLLDSPSAPAGKTTWNAYKWHCWRYYGNLGEAIRR